MTRIQCRCGAVEIAISVEPIAQMFCHCDDCQAVHGAAYAPESVYPAGAVEIVRGETLQWILKRNPRYMCARCGTKLFIDVLAARLRGVNGYLLPDGGFRPTYHMQCQFAVRPVVDDLPHYKSRSPQFGGPDEVVEW
ncbi:GFA family protein [Methylovirgula sp. 4M-Z18]|uniref:GFA family protein n=1 Tax=Methylovirgula sp. 4M-Z18 TaxID=2293567 RepID=UPI000E2E57D5|nr:GFA family protein [Methylovirgula sp. 4M-Z18]RFB79252.1 aldehyde-activating protein [Methylovirgula sp. 4M-Z18]